MMTLRHNGKISTQDDRRSIVEALVIREGKFLAVGSDREIMRFRDQRTKLIEADGIKLENCPLHVRKWIDELKDRPRRRRA